MDSSLRGPVSPSERLSTKPEQLQYGLPPSDETPDRPEQLARLAVRDHVGQLLRAHPCQVETSPDVSRAWAAGRPDEVVKVWVRPEGGSVAVGTLAGPGTGPGQNLPVLAGRSS